MLDGVKNFFGEKAAGAASAAGDAFEKLIPQWVTDKWDAFTHGFLLKLVIAIIIIVLITTLFDGVRRVIRGLDVAAIGGIFYYLGSKVPDIILIRSLIKPLHIIGMILMAVGVVIFIVFKILGALAMKGKIKLKSAVGPSGSNATSSGAAAAQAEDVAQPKGKTSVFKTIIACVLALAVGFGGGLFYNHKVEERAMGSIDFTILSEQITEISELATIQDTYKANVPYDGKTRKFWKTDWDIPFSQKTMDVEFKGTIKLGPDMKDLSAKNFKLDKETKTLTVTIPHSKVLSHEIDEDSWTIKDQKNGLFNRLTPQDDSDLHKMAKKQGLKKVDLDKLLAKADEKAQEQIKEFLGLAYKNLTIEVVSE